MADNNENEEIKIADSQDLKHQQEELFQELDREKTEAELALHVDQEDKEE
ncbi:hypothetical protein GO730_04375 [Spirosoma sp. HMF3257]|nr:hypothetical protein [Spirosoma telluris]